MSDFIFSTTRHPEGQFAQALRSIYASDAPTVSEFHGAWGSLAATRNLYHGLQALDTERHLCVVVGGPVLTFASNSFLTGDDDTAGTRLILDKYYTSGVRWDHDLSGPFAVVIIDKISGAVNVATDMMGFISVYRVEGVHGMCVGTHSDALAKASGIDQKFDPISLADFVLDGAVTFPYTAYADMRQLDPATVHSWSGEAKAGYHAQTYWEPREDLTGDTLEEAATKLRLELQDYTTRVTESIQRIACFVSGGEDSRAVLGLLPQRCQRDAFIFLDAFNREGRIAAACVEAYGANFKPFMRSPSFYLEHLFPAAQLMGSTWEARHAHTFEFHNTAQLTEYPAVFGGYLSDSFLKGHHIKKFKLGPFLPQIARPRLPPTKVHDRSYFADDMLREVAARRQTHYDHLKRLRPKSAAEWFTLWPTSMRLTMASFQSSRRLFRTYEPFMAAGVVKIAASSPVSWKLNRRLFHRAVQPLLQPVASLPHSDGRMPYYPWYNVLAHGGGWLRRKIEIRNAREDQGAWTTLGTMSKSDVWPDMLKRLEQDLTQSRRIFGLEIGEAALRWPMKYQLRLMQILRLHA